MSLLDEFKSYLEEDEGLGPDDVKYGIPNATQVSNKYRDSGRWSEHWTAVFKRDDEYVALDYEVPATEMQEGGDFYSEVYAVRPVEVTVTKYEKI